MKPFMDEDFILSNETAKMLYHNCAETLPIIDYHCHISPQEIAEDKVFKNITQLWLAGDHYKWRLMRSNGVSEEYITGTASDFEKFQKWAETLERAIGNPLYHWSHLELKRYFGYEDALNGRNAREVYEWCSQKIREEQMSARYFIKKSNVRMIGTTDDPVDDLHWHQQIEADKSFDVRVIPMWRPDKVLGIEKDGFTLYMKQLSRVSEVALNSFAALKKALSRRMDLFQQMGCTGSDHGLMAVPFEPAEDMVIDTILLKGLGGESVSEQEIAQYQTACLMFLGQEYARRQWVMQLHMGVTRNHNTRLFQRLGADTGFDAIYNRILMEPLMAYLDALDQHELLPKTIIYSLNPGDNAVIGSLVGCFQDSSCRGKLQQGSAWWFNDHEAGMREQMTSLANLGILGNFIGMLTDSRSFLSYTRHEYFRRILCDMIGTWIETGRYPADLDSARGLVTDICYNNAETYFNLIKEVPCFNAEMT